MRAVVEIEQHRLEHDITDGRTVLGPRPVGDREAADAWHRVNNLISDAVDLFRTQSTVALPGPVVERVPMRIEGPTLDIGM